MNKNLFNELSKENVLSLKELSEKIQEQGLKAQKERINEESPYSTEINNAFSGYNEFNYIRSIGLKEAFVTRKALIRDINHDLFVTCKQKTNHELMSEGSSPYVSDNEDACVVIHHIGQGFDAPFAELTVAEHSKFGNSKSLHDTKIESWRYDKDKVNQFQTEKIAYWRTRAQSARVETQINLQSSSQDNYQKDIIIEIKNL